MTKVTEEIYNKAIVETLTELTESYEKQVDVDENLAGMIINKCAFFASLVKGKLFGEDTHIGEGESDERKIC